MCVCVRNRGKCLRGVVFVSFFEFFADIIDVLLFDPRAADAIVAVVVMNAFLTKISNFIRFLLLLFHNKWRTHTLTLNKIKINNALIFFLCDARL